MTPLLRTERLLLRHLTPDDADFMLELLNDPSFIRNIGDRGVRTLEDARATLATELGGYARLGFGMYLVELAETGERIGVCGLRQRDYLEDPDVGYAFLERFRARGYAGEAAAAVRGYAHGTLGIPRLLAITRPDNPGSIRVLERIGLRFDRTIQRPDETVELRLYTSDA